MADFFFSQNCFSVLCLLNLSCLFSPYISPLHSFFFPVLRDLITRLDVFMKKEKMLNIPLHFILKSNFIHLLNIGKKNRLMKTLYKSCFFCV